MNVFYCDIMGTFTGSSNRVENLKSFVELLKQIIEIDNLDNLVFSFVSSDSKDIVIPFMEELELYLNNPRIKIGSCFADKEKIESGKIEVVSGIKSEEIFNDIETNKYENVYYAEDTIINQMIIREIFVRKFKDSRIVSFVPGNTVNNTSYFNSDNKGLEGLNECIDLYINERKNIR